uniref:Uncharacterized protein n=1 Tax=Arundo donax TaxID=35708 RepID=A0A0A9E9S2_ARUDO
MRSVGKHIYRYYTLQLIATSQIFFFHTVTEVVQIPCTSSWIT